MIAPISAEETLAVRHPVLRPGRSRAEAVFGCDADTATRHLGAFDECGRLVGVVTFHPAAWPGPPTGPVPEDEAAAWQLRGMATLPEVRGRGFGAALVGEACRSVRAAGGRLFWCNARVAALAFYRRLGWEAKGEAFEIPTVGPHYRMIRRLDGE